MILLRKEKNAFTLSRPDAEYPWCQPEARYEKKTNSPTRPDAERDLRHFGPKWPVGWVGAGQMG